MLKGSIVALVTPFKEDGKIDFEKVRELIEYHYQNHTDGICLLGTTGEASTIPHQEQVDLLKFALPLIKGRMISIVGAGSNDTLKAMKLAKEFSALGADYLLVITPYYNKTNKEGLRRHFSLIAEASSSPIILYNVPSRTGLSIPVDLVKDLSTHPNIHGIKEASGNISYAMKISRYINDQFALLSGNDDMIVPLMSIKGSGVISVLANICPSLVHDMVFKCLENNYQEAYALASKSLDLTNALFLEVNPIPVKEAMNYLGFKVGIFHEPLYQMDHGKLENLKEEIEKVREVIDLCASV